MDKILEKTLLYDFYGELLTERQKKICESYYLHDLSLAEISENISVSRQAVYDSLKRSEKQLYYYEEKLNLVSRFLEQKGIIQKIVSILDDLKSDNQDDRSNKLEQIRHYTDVLLEDI